MTQGIWVEGQRPKSKKAVKEAVAAGLDVVLEATSFFGNEYDGPLTAAPEGTYFIVGPNPHHTRNFFGQIIVKNGKVTVK
jgi:hypothetical protein